MRITDNNFMSILALWVLIGAIVGVFLGVIAAAEYLDSRQAQPSGYSRNYGETEVQP